MVGRFLRARAGHSDRSARPDGRASRAAGPGATPARNRGGPIGAGYHQPPGKNGHLLPRKQGFGPGSLHGAVGDVRLRRLGKRHEPWLVSLIAGGRQGVTGDQPVSLIGFLFFLGLRPRLDGPRSARTFPLPAPGYARPGTPPARTRGLGLCKWLLTLKLGGLNPWDWGYGSGFYPVDGWFRKNSAYCSGVCKMTTTPPPGSGVLPIVIEMVPMRVPIARSSPVIAAMSFDQRDIGGGYSLGLGLCKWQEVASQPSAASAPPHRSSPLLRRRSPRCARLLSARVAQPADGGWKRP